MAENTEKISVFKKIGNFFRGVRTEYSKIVFPDRETLKKQTTAVIVISVIIGLLIFLLDFGMQNLLSVIFNIFENTQ